MARGLLLDREMTAGGCEAPDASMIIPQRFSVSGLSVGPATPGAPLIQQNIHIEEQAGARSSTWMFAVQKTQEGKGTSIDMSHEIHKGLSSYKDKMGHPEVRA